MYGLPSISPADGSYRLVASWCVFSYIAAFTVISTLMAVYKARKSIFSACLTVIGGLFNVCRFLSEHAKCCRGADDDKAAEHHSLFAKS